MILSPRLKMLLIATSVSVALFSWSVYDSLIRSVNYITFFVELTDDLKLVILLLFQSLMFVWIDYALSIMFFGDLRIIESEHVAERLPLFIINLCFNLSINDNNLIFNGFLLSLTASFKFFHIIFMDRLEHVGVKILNRSDDEVYTRQMFFKDWFGNMSFWLNIIFIILDFSIAKFLVYDVFQGINTVTYLLYGFQSAIQGVEALSFFAKVLLNIYESWKYRVNHSNLENGVESIDDDGQDDIFDELERIWENKPYYTKSVEVISASLRAFSYVVFIYLLTLHSEVSWPFSMLQGTYVSLKQTYTEVMQFAQFIESSRRLDKSLGNATKEDLEDSDSLCIICRDDMHAIDTYESSYGKKLPSRKYPKKLKCNHILHAGCLKSWLERSENCPLCRKNVFQDDSSAVPENNHIRETTSESEQENMQPEIDNFNQNTDSPFDEDSRTRIRNLNSDDTSAGVEINDHERVLEEPTEHQIINIASTSTIPPGWLILPIKKMRDGEYQFSASNTQRGTLSVKETQPHSELDLIRNFEEIRSSSVNARNNDQ